MVADGIRSGGSAPHLEKPLNQLRSTVAGPQRPGALDMRPLKAGPRAVGLDVPVALAAGVGIVVAMGFVWTLLDGNYNQFGALLVALVLLVATVPLARHAARIENWPGLSSLLMCGVALRLVGSIGRNIVAYGLYGGVADASTYETVAQNNYHAFRDFHGFVPDTSVYHGLIPWLNTVIYAIAGPTELGSFFVFAWLNFLGCYLFFRAFRIAFPGGDGRRYAFLVILLPSLLYWPSSLGKEGWMMFALGLASYGLARALAGRFGGYLSLVAGLGGVMLVRPHLALIFLPAALLAFVVRRGTPGRRRPLARLVGVLVVVMASLVVVGKVQSYFGLKNLDVQSVTHELNTTRVQTAVGASAFNPPNAQSPLGYPEAVITVLFRPFPWEARSATVLVSSGEGVLLLGLAAASWRRLRRLPHFLVRNPYVMFCFVYCALFILAFSNFSNFGILARERVQVLPMFLVVLALPLAGAGDSEIGSVEARPDVAAIDAPSAAKLRRSSAARRSGVAAGETRAAARPFVVGSYRALDFRFDVEVAAAPFRSVVRHTLADLSSREPAAHHYRLGAVPGPTGLLAVVSRDGQHVVGPSPISDALAHLVTNVNLGVLSSCPDKLLLHAGAVSLGGRGLLLPGPSGAGKSTLTAALVSRGFGYLSDEAAAIDPAWLEIEPYPKPLSLRARSLELLAHKVGTGHAEGTDRVIPSSVLRARAVSRPVPPRFLVFPCYEPGTSTTLTPMSRAEAMVDVAGSSFNFIDHGSEWMPLLQRLVTACWCGRLTMGNLDEATQLLVELARAEGGVTGHGRRTASRR